MYRYFVDPLEKYVVVSSRCHFVCADLAHLAKLHANILIYFFGAGDKFTCDSTPATELCFNPQVKLELIRQAENLEQVKDILEDKSSEVDSPSTVAS